MSTISSEIAKKHKIKEIENACVSLKEENGIPFISFKPLEKYNLIQGFSTKLGGVSVGDCATMNLSFSRGDSVEDVKKNHILFAECIGYSVDDLVLTDQVHSTNILCVGKEDCGEVFYNDRTIRETDALITNEPGVVLMTFFADCVPLIFYDPVKNVVANAHSGWRGTVAMIGKKVVEKMVDKYGSSKKDIVAIIGPSICSNCYEVSLDLVDEFSKIFDEDEIKEVFSDSPEERGKDHKQLDLWKANWIVLEKAGLDRNNIYCSEVCTCCNNELLFSHRYTKGKRGNLSAVIGLKS